MDPKTARRCIELFQRFTRCDERASKAYQRHTRCPGTITGDREEALSVRWQTKADKAKAELLALLREAAGQGAPTARRHGSVGGTAEGAARGRTQRRGPWFDAYYKEEE